MAFGVYVHIPYCLQRCVYCDFATYEVSRILPPEAYIRRVKKEIRGRGPSVGPRPVDTIYFGGGTPSLLNPQLLAEVIKTLEKEGFTPKADCEITLEINPATVTEAKIELLLAGGFNRFSVGAQTFDDALLTLAHRKHSAQDTRDTLSLLNKYSVNFSADILFALPTQTLSGLDRDLDEVLSYFPPHVSPYCLTVPESNPMAKGRPHDGAQVEMFELIERRLGAAGLRRYEISNFAKPGFESRHNLIYWDDEEYWGIGLSSHSYLHRFGWGYRFWNDRAMERYVDQEFRWDISALDESRGERLQRHQALTDFFHISLRKKVGLDVHKFQRKFGESAFQLAGPQIKKLVDGGMLGVQGDFLFLTAKGLLISNRVFEELTFLAPSAPNIDKKAL